jgi:hypothetical protein
MTKSGGEIMEILEAFDLTGCPAPPHNQRTPRHS